MSTADGTVENAGLQAIHDRIARNRAKLEAEASTSKTVAFAEEVETHTIEAREESSVKPAKEKTSAKKKYLKRKLDRKKAAKKAQVLQPAAGVAREASPSEETPEQKADRKKVLKEARKARRSQSDQQEASPQPTATSKSPSPPPPKKEKKSKPAKEILAQTAPAQVDEELPAKTSKALEKAARAIKKSQKRKAHVIDEPDPSENAIQLEALPRFARPAKPAGPDASLLATLNVAEELRTGSRIPSALTVKMKQTNELTENGGNLLSKRLRDKLDQQGISDFFAVQAAVLPLMLGERAAMRRRSKMAQRDLCVNAPTGSGKTLAYVLPIVELLASKPIRRLRALVVLPTKDLALQIKETFDLFVAGTDLKVSLMTGNRKKDAEKELLQAAEGSNPVDILITTPGRLMDHILDNTLPLQHLEFLVADEADRLLNQDFNDWLPLLLDALKEVEEARRMELIGQNCSFTRSHKITQKLLFSATLSRDPVKIASLDLTKPLYVAVTDETTSIADHEAAEFALPATLKEAYMVLSSGVKPLLLAQLMVKHEISDALCFTKSTEAARRLTSLLTLIAEEVPELASKLKTSVFSSDMPLKDRSRILQQFKAGELTLLVCSDLISRGIDIPHVKHVFNYDTPIDIRKYVHRVGRTARAGHEGSAWTLVEEQEASYFKNLMRQAGRLSKLERLRFKDKDIEELMPGYERALGRLKDSAARQ